MPLAASPFNPISMSETEWAVQDGAIVERPRNVRKHPLLAAIYDKHDALIAEQLPAGNTVEIAFGQHMHPQADIGIEAWQSNARDAEKPAVAGDARSLPFEDGTFDAVIGRRFLHHVPAADRRTIVEEAHRILKPDGRLVILEGTPGRYRSVTKRVAFRLGLLDDDTDLYGHLSQSAVTDLVRSAFDVIETRPLGSPLMPASIAETPLAEALFPLYQRTQWITWWTLAVGRKPLSTD